MKGDGVTISEALYVDVLRAVHAVAWHWPTVDPDDMVQRVSERLLKEPNTVRYLNAQGAYKRQVTLRKFTVKENAQEVSDYETFNAEDTYTVSEIRYLLAHGILTEELLNLPGEELNQWHNACNVQGPSSAIVEGQKFYILDVFDFRDLFRMFARSNLEYAEIIFRHYVMSDADNDRRVRHAVTALTQTINRKLAANRSKARQDAALNF